MSLKFIVDANLSWRLANWLREQGHEASHVHALKAERRGDSDIWNLARQTGAVVVSKDEDFANRHRSGEPPDLIWIRWGNTSRSETIRKLEKSWPEIVSALQAGEGMIELID
jgi:predicted nuclease of predicted toxin-antitoxin system